MDNSEHSNKCIGYRIFSFFVCFLKLNYDVKVIPYTSTLLMLNWDLKTHMEVQKASKRLNEPYALLLFCPLALYLLSLVLDLVKRPPPIWLSNQKKNTDLMPESSLKPQEWPFHLMTHFMLLLLLMDVKKFYNAARTSAIHWGTFYFRTLSQMVFPCAGWTCFGEGRWWGWVVGGHANWKCAK